MEIVPRRDAAMLTPAIQRNILPGTRIWIDEWRAYHQLPQLDYVHEMVNHSQHFVSTVTGVHTNNIEACWPACRAMSSSVVPQYVHVVGMVTTYSGATVFDSIIHAIRVQYPV